MSDLSLAPDIGAFDIPIDRWTAPFWAGTARHELLLPCCGACGRFRWPPGPFCPACQSQAVDWTPAGPGAIYSYTIITESCADEPSQKRIHVPVLIEFAAAGHVRLLAALVAQNPSNVRIGVSVRVGWVSAGNATVPIFTIDD